MRDVKTIYVVFKTHFDIGFTKLAAEIVANYAQTMLPAVVETCEKTQIFGERQRYVWTMSAWPLIQSLNPEIADLTIIRRAKELIKQGQIAWHILPFTTHTEFCGLEEFIRGLYFSKELSEEYHGWPIAAKMTDVPGHTWILPSVLNKAGVKFLHLGCNPGSTPPAVPRLFFWEGPDGGRVLTFYNKGFYGSSLIPPEDWPYPVWLALQQTGDNIGPQGPEIIQNIIDEVKCTMPGTDVIIGTMDDFYLALAQYPLEDIPIIRGDLADSWIHGVGTYPSEVKQIRRIRTRVVEVEKAISFGNIFKLFGQEEKVRYQSQLKNTYEKSLLFGEHTWGLDVKTVLGYQRHYRKDRFLKDKHLPINQKMEQSWDEQRGRVTAAAESLESISPEVLNKIAATVNLSGPRIVVFNGLGWKRDAWVDLSDYRKEFEGKSLVCGLDDPKNGDCIEPMEKNGHLQAFIRQLPAFGYKAFTIKNIENPVPGKQEILVDSAIGSMENQWFILKVDQENGVVCSLKDKISGKEWVDQSAGNGLGQYRYDIYGDEDITEFIRAYAYRFYDWFVNDFGKMAYPPQDHLTFIPHGFSLTAEAGREYTSLILKTEIKDHSIKEYGNTRELITRITLYANNPWVDFEFTLNGKEETQFVEAGHFVFPLNLKNPQIRINKLGSVINPARDIIKDANHTLYCCENWLDLSDGVNGMAVVPFDTPLFSIGDQAIYKYRRQYQEEKPILFFNAFNNSWGTNFPQWLGGNYSFRYRLIPHPGDWKQGQIPKVAFESTVEPLLGFAGNHAPSVADLPALLDLFQCPEGLVIQAFKPAENGAGFILRLREIAGEARKVIMPIIEGFYDIARCNILEQLPQDLQIDSREVIFETAPFEIHTFFLKFK